MYLLSLLIVADNDSIHFFITTAVRGGMHVIECACTPPTRTRSYYLPGLFHVLLFPSARCSEFRMLIPSRRSWLLSDTNLERKKRLTWLHHNELAKLLCSCPHHFSFLLQKEKWFQSVPMCRRKMSFSSTNTTLPSITWTMYSSVSPRNTIYRTIVYCAPCCLTIHMCVGKAIKYT